MKHTINIEIPVVFDFTAKFEEIQTVVGPQLQTIIEDIDFSYEQVAKALDDKVDKEKHEIIDELLDYIKHLKNQDTENQGEINALRKSV